MTDFPPSVPALVRDTVRDPKQTARRILSWNLPERTLWEALALGVLLTVLLLVSLVLLTTQDVTDPASLMMREIYGQPLVVTVGQGINSVITVFAVYWVGNLFGGAGTFAGSLALIAWHQMFMLIVGLFGMAVGMFLPGLLSILLIVMIVLYFYVLTQFVCALHGFGNAAPVFGMIVVSMLSIYLVVSAVTTFLAVIFLGDAPNV